MPKEFDYANEDDFVQRFIIPLLHRLGFSVIANYHRTQGEQGKDLVFAEIDRFGHIRYSGLQAKYEPSIGQNAIQSVVQDCRQAFACSFIHPHTQVEERIQTFYAVNGGSFSIDASNYFFDAIGPPLSACSRLIDGKALLVLDRWAAVGQSQTVLPILNGMLIEISGNQDAAKLFSEALRAIDRKLEPKAFSFPFEDYIPLRRFRNQAASHLLTTPVAMSGDGIHLIDAYWSLVDTVNSRLDLLEGRITQGQASVRIDEILAGIDSLRDYEIYIGTEINQIMNTLAPMKAM